MAWIEKNLEVSLISALPPRRNLGFKTSMGHDHCFDHLHAVAYYASAVWPGRA